MKCQVVFLTRRGGSGLDYSTARAEFVTVFESYLLDIFRELPGRYRLWALIDLPPHRISELAGRLGYTEGILTVHEEALDDSDVVARPEGRWWRGWFRRNGRNVFQDELYVLDRTLWQEDSPHARPLQIEHKGEIVQRVGHRAQRGLSPLDARFLFNITPVPTQAHILDPFAGFGGLIREGQRRGHTMVAGDWELTLSPGLAETCRGRYVVADAQAIPFQTGAFDAVISEPPFRTSCRAAVLASVPEVHRMAPDGPIMWFVAQDMRDSVASAFGALGRKLTAEHWVRRNRGLRCAALCFQ